MKIFAELNEWITSIKNQLWWSFRDSIGLALECYALLGILSLFEGNPVKLKEQVLSIPLHLTNTHNFPGNKFHDACHHGELSKAWLSPDSKVEFCFHNLNLLFLSLKDSFFN